MPIRSSPLVLQALRYYSTRARAINQDRLGAATAIGYWCAVVSAPFAGAYAISQAAAKDERSTKWYVHGRHPLESLAHHADL